jgi:hypothetical protein
VYEVHQRPKEAAMSTRFLRAAAAATLLLVIGATAVSAGGWATIVADDGQPAEPRAGEDVEYGFTVLQHGVTPADFEDPTLRLTNTLTGESFDVPAEPSGPAGHFVARFTFPTGGSWSYGVQLRDLLVETQPITGMVLEADGSAPVLDMTQAFGAIGRAKTEISESLRSELLPRIDRLERDLGGVQQQAATLRTEVRTLTQERDDLAAQLATATGSTESATSPTDIPPLGVVILAVLGGALAGFAMAWLGQRRDPTAIETEAAPSGRPATT